MAQINERTNSDTVVFPEHSDAKDVSNRSRLSSLPSHTERTVKRFILAFIFAFLVLINASLLPAQEKPQLTANLAPDTAIYDMNLTSAPTLVSADQPAATNPADPGVPQAGTSQSTPGGTAQDDQWHFSVSPYLWLPGVHGTVGAFGRDVGFKASVGDLLSHFRLGVLGAVDVRRNRLLTGVDLMYMRLGDNQAIPFPNLLATTANLTANVVILTPKIGIRLINQKKFKADFLTGIRYWYFGENLNFTPSRLGLNFSKSQNWVDPLVGGRIVADLSPKIVTTIAGDVGGWGTGSQLEYQVVGALGYKLTPKMILQAGYRYLYFDYLKGGRAGTVVNTALSGIILGVTLNLK
jgi:hypothetical protein